MPRAANLIDRSEAPRKPTNQAYAQSQRAYEDIVRPLKDNPDKALRVEVDTSKDSAGNQKESQKGVSLALVYACERLGFEGKAWYDGTDAVYVAQATEAEANQRRAQKAKRKAASSGNGGNGSNPSAEPATGDQTPQPQAQKPQGPTAKK